MEWLLPEDLIYQILLHLPVDSLIQFKLVCKSWLSLIQSPNFINQHLQQYHHHHEEENLVVLGASSYRSIYQDIPFRISILSGTKFHILENIVALPHPLYNKTGKTGVYVRLVASYNGIICLRHVHGWNSLPDISIFNPATKQFNLLPISQLRESSLTTRKCPLGHPLPENSILPQISVAVGFGFDAKTNDYKVLRLPSSHLQRGVNNGSETQVEIYSLSTNSWKTIEIVVPHDLDLFNGLITPFRNGIYCWTGTFQSPTPHITNLGDADYIWAIRTICLFDFTKEEFETMPLPDICDRANTIFELAILRENLACIARHGTREMELGWSIWMLNEYGVKESWTQLYTVWLDFRLRPISFLKNDKIICEKDTNGNELVLSNPVTDELEIFPIHTRVSFQFQIPVVVYKKSLVSVRPLSGHRAC